MNKKLLLKAFGLSGIVALAMVLAGSWILSARKTGAEPKRAPGAGAVQFAPIPRTDLEAIYHEAWLAVPKAALDQNQFNHWPVWEHKFDGKIRTEKQLRQAIAEMLTSLGDRYMVVLTENELNAFLQATSGKLVGIGVNLSGLQIVSIVPDSPAAKAGLKPGDVVAYVDNQPVHPGAPQKLSALLRGSGIEGSKLSLVVMREKKQVKVELTRAVIRQDPAVRSHIGRRWPFFGFGFRSGFGSPFAPNPFTRLVRPLNPFALGPTTPNSSSPNPSSPMPFSPNPFDPNSWGDWHEPEKDTTGAIRIDNLRSATAVSELDTELQKMENEKMEGIVLDLRGLKGGSALTAAKVAALFLGDGKLINSIERIDGKEVTTIYQLRGGKLVVTTTSPGQKPVEVVVDTPVNRYKKPVFVVVDDKTTGAAELVVAALQGNHRATVFGVTTRGKASGQKSITIGRGYVLLVTVARYSGPDNKTLDGVGVKPDVQGDTKQGNLYGQAVLALRDQIEKTRPKAEVKPDGGSGPKGEVKPDGGNAPKGDVKPGGNGNAPAGSDKPSAGNSSKGEAKP